MYHIQLYSILYLHCHCYDYFFLSPKRLSPIHEREYLEKFCLWSPEYWALESRTLLREIWNPSKVWNPESKFPWQEVESSIQDCLGFPYMGQPRIPRNNLFLFAAFRFLGIPGNSIFQIPWNLTPLVPRNSYLLNSQGLLIKGILTHLIQSQDCYHQWPCHFCRILDPFYLLITTSWSNHWDKSDVNFCWKTF